MKEQRFTAICVQCGQRIEWGHSFIARIVRHFRKYNHDSVRLRKAIGSQGNPDKWDTIEKERDRMRAEADKLERGE